VTTHPQQRILFLLAGTVTLAGILLTVLVSDWFVLLPAFAEANQLLYFAVGWCPASLLLNRIGVAEPACTPAPVSPIGRP
jgi:hypothetical protein